MDNKIAQKIENINAGIKWISEHDPDHYERCFLQLVEERRKLRVLANAERNNAGVAAFGQSQVGKSYLMNCMLQDKSKPFMVDYEEGEYNFIDTINPIGEGAEATGVITRFSAYKLNPHLYNKKYPVRFRSYSVKDVIITICDAYFNDFQNYTTEGESELSAKAEAWKTKYTHVEDVKGCPMSADDILDIKSYFKKHINNAQVYSTKTTYMDRLALIIDKVPIDDYIDVFGVMWQYNPNFNMLFNKCLNVLKRLKFEEYVYLPITAVMHGGLKEDTVMSVTCLKLLFEEKANNYMTQVYRGNGQQFECLGNFTKSELCTVCSEVIFKIREEFVNSTGSYDFRNIEPSVAAQLTRGQISMQVLNNCDLLDFPGARARENMLIEKLDGNSGELMYAFLRGKVAYLFNSYNEEKAINILLYCHYAKNNDATQMQHLLREWVNEYVGDTPQKRANLIRQTRVSPLFHVGTMWNLNLEEPDNKEVGTSEKAITGRWNSRFNEILAAQCFHRDANEWVDNWTGPGQTFQNCYMLRDYNFSKKIYGGFAETGREESMVITAEYYNLMKVLFCKASEEHHFFADPAKTWDVASSIGNDGAVHIIENLSVVARNIARARETQIAEQTAQACVVCNKLLAEYYQTSDVDEILDANIRKANGIFREMEFACQEKPDFFGHLLQALQLTEAESFKELHRLIPELTQTTYGDSKIKDYELIRKRCNYFKDCGKEEEKWDALIRAYRFSDRQEAVDYLDKRQIDVLKLFAGEKIRRKNSAVIADDMLTLWQNNITSTHFNSIIAADGIVDDIALSNLTTCIINTAEQVNLPGYIESLVSDYVDIMNAASINEDLVADIIATTISDFVMDFGYQFLTDKQIASSKRVSADRNLPCFRYTQAERKEHFDEDEMTELLNDILTLSTQYTPAYEANYNKWLEFMYIAFVAHINVPDFDREANDRLKEILDAFKN